MVIISLSARACPARRPVYSKFLLLVAFLSSAPFSIAHGNDFQSLQAQINAQRAVVEDIQSRFDRIDQRLLEPLVDLARAQTAAYRFDDAELTLDQALQIVRIRDGLYSPAQYPILEQAIENNVRRGAWNALTEELEHVNWLYAIRFEGDTEQQVEHLMWLSDIYQRGALLDLEIRRVDHLKDATRVNELAGELAIRETGLSVEHKVDILYSLIKKYHVQAQGIISGGEIGMALRGQEDESGKLDRRKLALRKRFVYGLRLLDTIREIVRSERPGDAEALALVDVSIADWHLLFDRPDAYDQYQSAFRRMAATGIAVDKIDAFFGQPLALPRPALVLDLDAAIAGHPTNHRGPMLLMESSSSYPGVARQLTPDRDLKQLDQRRFTPVAATLSFEPGSGSSHWLAGTYRQTQGTAVEVKLGSIDDSQKSKRIRKHLQEVRFRPVQKNGELQASVIQVDYLVRRRESTREIALTATLVGQL